MKGVHKKIVLGLTSHPQRPTSCGYWYFFKTLNYQYFHSFCILDGSCYPRRKTLTLAYDELASAPLDYLPKLHATKTFWTPPSKMVLGPYTGVKLNVRHFVEPYTALRTTAWWTCQLLRKRQTFDGNVATKGAASARTSVAGPSARTSGAGPSAKTYATKRTIVGSERSSWMSTRNPNDKRRHRSNRSGNHFSCESALRPCVPMPPIITEWYDAHRTERLLSRLSRWRLQRFFCFHPYLGKISNLTNSKGLKPPYSISHPKY